MFHGLLDGFGRIFIIFQFSTEVGFISAHIEIAVTREIEKDHVLLAFCLGI